MKGKEMDTLNNILKRLKPEIQPQTVSVYTRHSANCSKRQNKEWKDCDCPKSLYVFQDGKNFRISARTRSWKKAEGLKREVEDSLDPVQAQLRRMKDEQQATRVTISNAIHLYLLDAETRSLTLESIAKLKIIFKTRLLCWTEQNSLVFLDQLTTMQLTRWRSTWTLAPITKRNRQQLVRNFFRFCIDQGWLKNNPAVQLTKIQVTPKVTDYFPREEFRTILKATYLFAQGAGNSKACSTRIRTLLLLMRWSGLRIGDAATLERSRLSGNTILLYQAKTGTSVYVPIPASVAKLLRNIPPGFRPNPGFFFWSGNSRKTSVVSTWDRAFRTLFRIANIRKQDGSLKRCHPHMLRDTFAIEHLLAGVPIDQVSMLLGHRSIKTTEKHYAPWVKARQEQLEKSVKMSNSVQGVERFQRPPVKARTPTRNIRTGKNIKRS
jgi:integrase/recombinase XerD